MADGDTLFTARGMNHKITLIESTRGVAVLVVGSLFGEGTATVSPEERLEMAKALYPEAFTGNEVATTWEYSRFKDGEPQGEILRTPRLISLSLRVGETAKKRVPAGDWQDVTEEEMDLW